MAATSWRTHSCVPRRHSCRRASLLLPLLLTPLAQAQFTQQAKLVGSGAVNTPYAAKQGPVALSADGNTAIIGGPQDNNFTGAAWIFTRSGGVRTQQGGKLVGIFKV